MMASESSQELAPAVYSLHTIMATVEYNHSYVDRVTVPIVLLENGVYADWNSFIVNLRRSRGV
jgi:hypothetical protein